MRQKQLSNPSYTEPLFREHTAGVEVTLYPVSATAVTEQTVRTYDAKAITHSFVPALSEPARILTEFVERFAEEKTVLDTFNQTKQQAYEVIIEPRDDISDLTYTNKRSNAAIYQFPADSRYITFIDEFLEALDTTTTVASDE